MGSTQTDEKDTEFTTIYQKIRKEELGLTREQAFELMNGTGMSEGRLEKIEKGKTSPAPEDIVIFAKAYKKPALCNQYCTSECAIGKEYRPQIAETSNLSTIVMRTLVALNKMEEKKNRLMEISEDEQITDDELEDFIDIQDEMEKIELSLSAFKLWVSNEKANGRINVEQLERLQKKRSQL